MATIDWEERVFQLASSILVNHINDIDIETAIEVAQNFKEKYIEKMSLDEPKKEKKSKEKEAWKEDFEVYANLVLDAKYALLGDNDVREAKTKYYQNLDYDLTLDKMVNEFWGTKEGWEYKKKHAKKTVKIDMVSTLKKGFDISSNRVYKRNGVGQTTPARPTPMVYCVSPKPADKTNDDGTFYKDGFRYYHSMRDNLDYSIPLNAPPMPSIDMEYDPLNKEWYNPSSIETHGLW